MKTENMKRIVFIAFVLFISTFTNKVYSQKAIILEKEYAKISLQSNPSGAKVYHNGKLICASTPATVEIPYNGKILPGKKSKWNERKRRSEEASAITLTFVKDGYISSEETITPDITQVKKSEYDFEWPSTVIHELIPYQDSSDPTIPVGESKKRVSRENPGQTSLERTIVRWYFDSAPQGARIFWRVISSVPEEVKNTNELWLGSTPYEETRSFNIQGLTYENSRDVQIEIKVKRKGYMDQNKRFNVRQAIDQQEISSFFDLIKEDVEEEAE